MWAAWRKKPLHLEHADTGLETRNNGLSEKLDLGIWPFASMPGGGSGSGTGVGAGFGLRESGSESGSQRESNLQKHSQES